MRSTTGAVAIVQGQPLGIAVASASVVVGLEARPIQVEVCSSRGPSFFQLEEGGPPRGADLDLNGARLEPYDDACRRHRNPERLALNNGDGTRGGPHASAPTAARVPSPFRLWQATVEPPPPGAAAWPPAPRHLPGVCSAPWPTSSSARPSG